MNLSVLIFCWTMTWMPRVSGNLDTFVKNTEVPFNPWYNDAVTPSWLGLRGRKTAEMEPTVLGRSFTGILTNRKEGNTEEDKLNSAVSKTESLQISKRVSNDGLQRSKRAPDDGLQRSKRAPDEGLQRSKRAPNEGLQRSKRAPDDGLQRSKRAPDDGLQRSKRAPDEGLQRSKRAPNEGLQRSKRAPDEGLQRSKRAPDDKTLSLKKVVKALEKLTKFLVRHAEEANFDTMMSIRMAQDQFQQVLTSLARRGDGDWLSQSGLNDWLQQTVTWLYVRLDNAAERIGVKGMETNPDYFTKFHPLVTSRFWQGWVHPPTSSPPITPTELPREGGRREGARQRMLKRMEEMTEAESDECMAELLPVPPTDPKDEQRRMKSRLTLDNEEDQIDDFQDESVDETIKVEDGVVKEEGCRISKMCWTKMTAPGLGGYSLTHQLLYLIIGRLAGCEEQLEAMASKSQQPDSRNTISNVELDFLDLQNLDPSWNVDRQFRPLRRELRSDDHGHRKDDAKKQGSKIDRMMRDQCHVILWEAGILAEDGFPEDRRDLFMEQGFLCGGVQFSPDFFTDEWVDQVLSWQKANGCYGIVENRFQRSILPSEESIRKFRNPPAFFSKSPKPQTFSIEMRNHQAFGEITPNLLTSPLKHKKPKSFLEKSNKLQIFSLKNNTKGLRRSSKINRRSANQNYLTQRNQYKNEKDSTINLSQNELQANPLTLNDILHEIDQLDEDYLEYVLESRSHDKEFLKNIQRNRNEKLWLSEIETKMIGLKNRHRSKRSEQIMSDQCQAHRSAVALGYLTEALRYLTEDN